MSMAKSTAFCAVADPSVPTPIALITASPLAVGVAPERALLRHLRVLPVPDRDRATERRGHDHAEDHPSRPALGHVDYRIAEHRRDREEDDPLDCDSRVHAVLRASLDRARAPAQTRLCGR